MLVLLGFFSIRVFRLDFLSGLPFLGDYGGCRALDAVNLLSHDFAEQFDAVSQFGPLLFLRLWIKLGNHCIHNGRQVGETANTRAETTEVCLHGVVEVDLLCGGCTLFVGDHVLVTASALEEDGIVRGQHNISVKVTVGVTEHAYVVHIVDDATIDVLIPLDHFIIVNAIHRIVFRDVNHWGAAAIQQCSAGDTILPPPGVNLSSVEEPRWLVTKCRLTLGVWVRNHKLVVPVDPNLAEFRFVDSLGYVLVDFLLHIGILQELLVFDNRFGRERLG